MSGGPVLALLATAGLEELRAEWAKRFGDPPGLRSPEILRRTLAWRIQTTEQGGFDTRTRRLLRAGVASRESMLATGTVIAREWQGVRHEVEVTDEGYIHGGRSWSSLSEIARAITGTRWNGPRFFGLRQAA